MVEDQMFQSSNGRTNVCFNILNLFFVVFALAAFVSMAVITYRFNDKLEEHLSKRNDVSDNICKDNVDIAIVGAGVSGAYAAWKLSEKYPEKSITIYESNSRVGGRAYSVTIPGVKDFVADLGAMRFRPAYDRKTWQVIQQLNLEVSNFSTPSASERLYYVRGKHLLQDDLDRGEVPYALSEEERNYTSSTEAFVSMLNRRFIVTGEDDPYKRVTKEGDLVYKLGNTNQWLKYGSQEHLSFLADISGFSSWIYTNQNLASVSETSDPGITPPPFLTVKAGMDAIPKGMIDRFLTSNSDRHKLHLRHELVAINSSTANITITLYDKESQQTRQVCTTKLILAIHPEAVNSLDWTQAPESNPVDIKIEAIRSAPAVKIYLAYDYPWWRYMGQGGAFDSIRNSGEALKEVWTDLPVGTLLDIGVDSITNKSVLLVYNAWYNSLKFWQSGLEIGEKDPSALEEEFTPSKHLIDLLQNQLADIFNISITDIPQPNVSVGQAWYKKPYYAAWHYWSPGDKHTTIQEQMMKPVNNQDVYIIGEAFATRHGWMQGALDTAEEMIEKYFD